MTIDSGPRLPHGITRLLGHWNRHEKLRFLVIGAYNTAFGYLVFTGAYLLLRSHVHYLVILVITHFLSVLNAFIGHKFLTFKAKGHLLADYFRFNLTYLGALIFGLLALPFMVEVCKLHILLSQAILIAINMMGTYFLHKWVSFRRS